MEPNRIIEVDEFERGVVINALNDFRNDLIEEKRDTSDVDDVLLKIIRAKECGRQKRTVGYER